jgi:hypothetical protein
MPMGQVASVPTYDVGCPAAEAAVLKFAVSHGGKATIRFENDGDNDATVSVQVSADNSTYVDTSDAQNLKAVVDEVIQRGCKKEFVVLLRPGKDLFMQVLAYGNTRMQVQIRPDMGLTSLLQ